MKRHGQLNCPQGGAGVAANARHGFQNVLSNFVGNWLQILRRQSPQICWGVYILKKMHLRGIVTCWFRFLLLTKF